MCSLSKRGQRPRQLGQSASGKTSPPNPSAPLRAPGGQSRLVPESLPPGHCPGAHTSAETRAAPGHSALNGNVRPAATPVSERPAEVSWAPLALRSTAGQQRACWAVYKRRPWPGCPPPPLAIRADERGRACGRPQPRSESEGNRHARVLWVCSNHAVSRLGAAKMGETGASPGGGHHGNHDPAPSKLSALQRAESARSVRGSKDSG